MRRTYTVLCCRWHDSDDLFQSKPPVSVFTLLPPVRAEFVQAKSPGRAEYYARRRCAMALFGDRERYSEIAAIGVFDGVVQPVESSSLLHHGIV